MRTIKSGAEITRLFKEGTRINTPELSLLVLYDDEQHDHVGRVAFIAGKKLGNAVWRNRAKRRMREVCRQVGGPFSGYDVAFVAKGRVNDSAFGDMVFHVRKSLEERGLLKI